MEQLLAFSIGILIGIILIDLCTRFFSPNNKYCNSKYNRKKDSLEILLDSPEYKITSVEEVYATGGGGHIAKYVLQNFYLKRKSNVNLQELILYDEIGKYNVGDILTLKKK